MWKHDVRCLFQGPTFEQVEVISSIVNAMSYLHSKNIVFRDLKPANVGFDQHGTLKLFDFGFAKGLPKRDEGNPNGFLFDRCGTTRYMAPEVGLNMGYGLKADVYSLGVLIWEVCALTKPFSSVKSSKEFKRTVFVGGERPIMECHWPACIRELMSSCWAASQNDRPTMQDVHCYLSSFMPCANDEPMHSRSPTRSHSNHR